MTAPRVPREDNRLSLTVMVPVGLLVCLLFWAGLIQIASWLKTLADWIAQ